MESYQNQYQMYQACGACHWYTQEMLEERSRARENALHKRKTELTQINDVQTKKVKSNDSYTSVGDMISSEASQVGIVCQSESILGPTGPYGMKGAQYTTTNSCVLLDVSDSVEEMEPASIYHNTNEYNNQYIHESNRSDGNIDSVNEMVINYNTINHNQSDFGSNVGISHYMCMEFDISKKRKIVDQNVDFPTKKFVTHV
ncbi:putative ORFan [Tupanvirus deep ocean]|uniref:ORFan n=2 Tax=Tupanvirus TaxID=2094720 RepID=A0AC62A952_9VIRU|nr:putative ORFan [Tupanvirus deep ocean]QKU34292.1 putative ORFan [Tupanvirus deep ocean]